ncbi:mitochondrial editing factor 18 [Actinidia rufa]|uniref:Mitochondrial editing factor 18 n=1 Tax=Actinidia rufa TaxID=165716 RepID=A0A7J0GGU1_9ERIC|nr:mitochondrial editing factor 18 [Actinidia rufa]
MTSLPNRHSNQFVPFQMFVIVTILSLVSCSDSATAHASLTTKTFGKHGTESVALMAWKASLDNPSQSILSSWNQQNDPNHSFAPQSRSINLTPKSQMGLHCNTQFFSTTSSNPEYDLRAFVSGQKPRKPHDYEVAIVSTLKSCSTLLAISQGQQIHGLVLVFDSFYVLDSVSCNIMIAGYVKLGRLNDARKLFDVMPHRGCVSYTTMIMGLAQNGCWSEAIRDFNGMRFDGVVPNEVTMSSVISAYSHLGGVWNCRLLHALVKKLGLEVFVLVSTNLVHMYCACSSLREARTLFDEMLEPNIVSWNVILNGYSKVGFVDLARDLFERIPGRDVVSWGTIVNCYVQVGRLVEAFDMYRAMLRTGLGPNDVMIVDMISACGQSMALVEGQQFHGSKDHAPSWNALIAGLVRNGAVDQARELFDEMSERDVFSWSSMISGYAQNEQPNMALELFHEMVTCVKPNEITMVSVLSAIATLGLLKEGRWAHEFIRNNSIPLNDNLSAAIIDMYAKCGSIKTALEVFHQIRDKTTTVSPWNAIICGLAMHGHAAGKRHFESMKKYGTEPNIKHYGCMVDLLGRAGKLEEAEDLIRSMPMKADVIIWGTLLAACRTHGNTEIGERAAENLARVEPSHGPGRVLLSSIYADAGRWEDAFLVRQAIRSQRMTRSPGYSGVV